MVDPNFPQDVLSFHELGQLPIGRAPHLPAGRIPHEKLLQHIQAAYVLTKLPSESEGQVALRVGLILDELAELIEALQNNDLVEVFDAILDIVYVTIGMGVSAGLPLNLGWAEVHRTNMNKVRGGPATIDGKVVKPEGWVGPEEKLRQLIERMQWLRQPQDPVEFQQQYELVKNTPVFEAEIAESELLPPEQVFEEDQQETIDARGSLQQDEREEVEEADPDTGSGGENSSGGGGLYGRW